MAVLMVAGVLAGDDMSHPHAQDSLVKNLRSTAFPDGSQHGKYCKQ